MVQINECRIDPEGKFLILEASVEKMDYFEHVFLSSVIIDTEDTYNESGPSSKAVYKYIIEGHDGDVYIHSHCGCRVTAEEDCVALFHKRKRIRLEIPAKDLGGIGDKLFFVYVAASGPVKPGTPCGYDEKYTMAVAYNSRPVYNHAMSYIKEIERKCCDIPKGFIDFILRMKAFELSLKTGNFITAIKQWQKLFKKRKQVNSIGYGCNCSGITG